MATTVIRHNSFALSHIESTFGMEILWDNRHQPHTSMPWKLQRCHELNMINALLMFHSHWHDSDSLTHWNHKIGNLGLATVYIDKVSA